MPTRWQIAFRDGVMVLFSRRFDIDYLHSVGKSVRSVWYKTAPQYTSNLHNCDDIRLDSD